MLYTQARGNIKNTYLNNTGATYKTTAWIECISMALNEKLQQKRVNLMQR